MKRIVKNNLTCELSKKAVTDQPQQRSNVKL